MSRSCQQELTSSCHLHCNLLLPRHCALARCVVRPRKAASQDCCSSRPPRYSRHDRIAREVFSNKTKLIGIMWIQSESIQKNEQNMCHFWSPPPQQTTMYAGGSLTSRILHWEASCEMPWRVIGCMITGMSRQLCFFSRLVTAQLHTFLGLVASQSTEHHLGDLRCLSILSLGNFRTLAFRHKRTLSQTTDAFCLALVKTRKVLCTQICSILRSKSSAEDNWLQKTCVGKSPVFAWNGPNGANSDLKETGICGQSVELRLSGCHITHAPVFIFRHSYPSSAIFGSFWNEQEDQISLVSFLCWKWVGDRIDLHIFYRSIIYVRCEGSCLKQTHVHASACTVYTGSRTDEKPSLMSTLERTCPTFVCRINISLLFRNPKDPDAIRCFHCKTNQLTDGFTPTDPKWGQNSSQTVRRNTSACTWCQTDISRCA